MGALSLTGSRSDPCGEDLGGLLGPSHAGTGASLCLVLAQRLWELPIPGIGRGGNPDERSTRR